jgi:hypothetical protein
MKLLTTHTGSTLPHLEVGLFDTDIANNEIMIAIKIGRVLADLIANLACASALGVKGQLCILSAVALLAMSDCKDRLA